MSYDIQLVIDTGGEHPAAVTECISPTYNLFSMFAEALGFGIRELEGQQAVETVAPLRAAIAAMEDRPDHFKTFNPPKKWGSYEGALEALRTMLGWALAHPKAKWQI